MKISSLFSNIFVHQINLNFISEFFIKSIRFNRNYLISFIDSHIIHYPTPININYAWSFGSLSGLCLVIQIITGLFLALHYTSHIDLAFSGVGPIMYYVNKWLDDSSIYANGASLFFIVVFSVSDNVRFYLIYLFLKKIYWRI